MLVWVRVTNVGQVVISVPRNGCFVWLCAGDLRSVLVNGEDRDYVQGGTEGSAVGIPYEKVTGDRILGGQLRSTVGIGTRLREELRSRRSRIPSDEVGYEITHGGWTPCGRDLRNGFHEVCVQASVFAKDIGRNWIGVYSATVRRGTVAYICVCTVASSTCVCTWCMHAVACMCVVLVCWEAEQAQASAHAGRARAVLSRTVYYL